jgi:hypothetical protein
MAAKDIVPATAALFNRLAPSEEIGVRLTDYRVRIERGKRWYVLESERSILATEMAVADTLLTRVREWRSGLRLSTNFQDNRIARASQIVWPKVGNLGDTECPAADRHSPSSADMAAESAFFGTQQRAASMCNGGKM